MAAVRSLARREREQFAELLAGLTDDQWDAPSLCSGWSVREVAAHTVAYLSPVSYTHLTLPTILLV